MLWLFLEKRFPLAADAKTPEFGGGLQHHLRDFSHHFSLGGLLFSLFTQFTGKVIGTDTAGAILIEQLSSDKFIGQNFEEKILFGSINWFFHMVSDMAGSSSTAGKGTGTPGPIVSLIKELSAIPCFKDKTIGETEFHTWVSKLFNGTLLAKRDDNGKILEPVKFDLRTEIGLLHEVGRQFIPVLLNECLVRGLYFLRRLQTAFVKGKNQKIGVDSLNTAHAVAICFKLFPHSAVLVQYRISMVAPAASESSISALTACTPCRRAQPALARGTITSILTATQRTGRLAFL